MVNLITDIDSISQKTDCFDFNSDALQKISIAPKEKGNELNNLILDQLIFSGDEKNLNKWRKWHHQDSLSDTFELGLYLIKNVTVNFFGFISVEGKYILSNDIIMPYAQKGFEQLQFKENLIHRYIDFPCIVWMGWGPNIYGHLMVEMLPRLIMARKHMNNRSIFHKYLVDSLAPKWFVSFLKMNLGLNDSDIEFFNSETERLHLKYAIIPTQIMSKRIHSFANGLYNEVFNTEISNQNTEIKKIFLTRTFLGKSLRGDFCPNEVEIAKIAAHDFGFTILSPETLPINEQIRIFSGADIVVGISGSALHSTIFSKSGCVVGGIGPNNSLQSMIANLKNQYIGYMAFDDKYKRVVNTDILKFFLDGLVKFKEKKKNLNTKSQI